jgi:COMPASS component SPP1
MAVDNVDAETLKVIEVIKQNDLGLRTKRANENVPSPTEPKPAPAVSKKRPAPAASTIKKKGTAALKKPASKKRKLDTEVDSNLNPRSTTPSSRTGKQAPSKGGRKGSQAGTPALESSPAPDNSSQIHASEDEADSSDDNTLYCICRKPDNHRWMIGCDGGCDDWFHGSCVDMAQADEDLVDKFICPNCEAAGRGETTWKPMCRREGCRRPARLVKGKESKYCSDDCGVLFFQEQLQKTAGAKKTSSKKPKRKSSKEDGRQAVSEEAEEPTPLGGVIRASDLKALAVAAKDADTFKRLGSGVLSPPHTASPTRASFDGYANGTVNAHNDLPFTRSEREHLGALRIEKEDLKSKLEILKDREKFVSMVREQATRYAENEKIKAKEFCGYDTRLAWSDSEFMLWRNSRFGRAAFKHDTLAPSLEQLASVDADEDVKMDGPDSDDGGKNSICTKKRCTKHPQWQKLNLQDARFEELEIVEAIKECEKSERSVCERARRRAQKDNMEAEVMGNEKSDDRNREGWVQAVEA